VWHKTLKEEDKEFFGKIIDRMKEDVPDQVRSNIINSLLELEFATRVGNMIAEYDAEEDIDIVEGVKEALQHYEQRSQAAVKIEYANVFDSTIGEVDEDGGLRWHIEVMNDYYRNILGGDQYIVAGRPGKGKTTFLTHLNWSLAQSMPVNKRIIWFNNESRRQRIMSRQIQSALNKTDKELKQMQRDGTLVDAYIEVMGDKDRVQVYDIHGMTNKEVEQILERVGQENVGALIFDMLDKVSTFMPKEMREDQRLEKLYDWSRELGVKYNCPVFPTSQISNEGTGELFPTENMLKDSKTGKQGACDGIIMIGCADDPMNERERGISMPKTKSKREGKPDMREKILIDEDRGRYLNC
jgi:replicative DNA helicase